jgi:TRAP-type mannitol/chloroaromatic compound transport system substrate-binding protein
VAAPSAFSQDRPETSKETLMQFLKRKDSAVAETAATGSAGTRRKFISRAAAATAGAAALGVPMVSRAQTVSFRFQSTWPAKDIFSEYANDFAKKVNDMAGNRLKIEVLPAGSVVPAFQLLDAVTKGTLDGGHGVLAYWYGKNSAVALWGSGPAFGMTANQVLAWHYYGGGKDLLDQIYKSLNMNVQSFIYGPMPTQPLGWFKKPITKVEELKGLKFRTVGLAVDIFTDLGAAVNPLPGGEIVPALDRGLIDGAEFNNATSDRILGFPDVSKNCMLQSFHQSGEQFEVLFNKPKYDALPQELKSVIDYAVQAASADMSWKAEHRYSQDYIELRTKDKVNFYKTPDPILRAQLASWDKVIAKKSAENEWFKKVLDSQRAFAERVGRWSFDTNVDFRMAYNHYFSRAAAPAKK